VSRHLLPHGGASFHLRGLHAGSKLRIESDTHGTTNLSTNASGSPTSSASSRDNQLFREHKWQRTLHRGKSEKRESGRGGVSVGNHRLFHKTEKDICHRRASTRERSGDAVVMSQSRSTTRDTFIWDSFTSTRWGGHRTGRNEAGRSGIFVRRSLDGGKTFLTLPVRAAAGRRPVRYQGPSPTPSEEPESCPRC
jgi:hypothetical protein